MGSIYDGKQLHPFGIALFSMDRLALVLLDLKSEHSLISLITSELAESPPCHYSYQPQSPDTWEVKLLLLIDLPLF